MTHLGVGICHISAGRVVPPCREQVFGMQILYQRTWSQILCGTEPGMVSESKNGPLPAARGAPGRRASVRGTRRGAGHHSRMTPFTTPPGGSGGSSCSLHRQGSASTMQRVREEKERINQLRATVRKDVQARPPAPSQSENDGESSSSWRNGHGDSDSATRTRIESVSTPQHQPLASPQPDATQQSGFGSRTLACRTASLGCGLLAFAEWMDGHTLRGLALMLLALACMCAASGSTSHSSQLEGITQPHGVDVAAASLL